MVAPEVSVSELHDRFIKTYRYLRMAMAGMLVMLAVGVFLWWREEGTLRDSISSYYYSPAKGVFIAALVTIGVCMIVLKGNTPWEDTFLNLAGMLAPVVAFVPTPARDTCTNGRGVAELTAANIDNNMAALLTVGVVAVIVTFAFARHGGNGFSLRSASGTGIVLSALVVAGGTFWYFQDGTSMDCFAHYTSAIPMFLLMVAVVGWNAWGYRLDEADDAASDANNVARASVNRYGVIAVLMIASVVVLGFLTWRDSIPHGVFWIEASVIALFCWFWAVQTKELWDEGVRGAPKPPDPN